MKVDRYLSTTEKSGNGQMTTMYVVHTNDNLKAAEAVRRKRRQKEVYNIRDGYVNRKGELFLNPEYGNTKVKVVTIKERYGTKDN